MFDLETIERNFDSDLAVEWMAKNWHISIYLSVVYVVCIFSIQHAMQNRQAMHLRSLLCFWSSLLAIFSGVSFYRTWPESYAVARKEGLHYVTCSGWMYHNDQTKLWLWLFVLSKAVELIDTMFIVLRKGKLIFLHWYHHWVTLVYSFYSYSQLLCSAAWATNMNLFIHTLMYSYYALKANGTVKVPKVVNVIITTLQIVQMLIDCMVHVYAGYVRFYLNQSCNISLDTFVFSMIMFCSYFALFGNFFYKTYMRPKTSKTKAQ